MDCRGLLLRAARDCGLLTDEEISSIPEMVNYLREPDGVAMPELLKKYCDYAPLAETGKLRAGDIICIKFAAYPQHLAIVTNPTKWGPLIVHAWQGKGVIEHRFDNSWLESYRAKLHGVFVLKSIEAE